MNSFQPAFLFMSMLLLRNLSVTRPTLWLKSPLISACYVDDDGQTEMVLGMTTSGACAMKCQLRKWCNSFRYTQVSGECDLCSLHYLGTDVLKDKGFTRYFRATSDECSMSEDYLWDKYSRLCLLVVWRPEDRVYYWGSARDACRHRNLEFVTLHTSARLDFTLGSLRHNDLCIGLPRKPFKGNYLIGEKGFHGVDFFIGAMRPQARWGESWPAEGPDFHWIANGTAVDTDNRRYWASDQPDNSGLQDNVLMVTGSDFLLSDVPDTIYPKSLGFICEKTL